MLIENNAMQSFRSMTQVGSAIYFLSCLGNELWRFDMKTVHIRMMLRLVAPTGGYEVVYRKIVRYHEMLVLVPNSANDICIYDTKSESVRKIPVPDIRVPYKHSCKFSNGFCKDNRIFLTPHCYPAVLVIDTDRWRIVECKTIDTNRAVIESEMFSGSFILRDNTCYIPSSQSNEVVELELGTCAVKTYRLGMESAWYGSISSCGESIWLTGDKNTITRWDIAHNIIKEWTYPKGFEKKDNSYPFLDSFCWQNKIILIPANANMYIIIDTKTEEIVGVERAQVTVHSPVIYTKNSQFVLLYDTAQVKLFIISKEKEEVTQMKIDSCLQAYIWKILDDGAVKREKNYSVNLHGNRIYEECNSSG